MLKQRDKGWKEKQIREKGIEGVKKNQEKKNTVKKKGRQEK